MDRLKSNNQRTTRKKNTKTVIHFNSHKVMWEHTENNANGENVKNWAERNNINLIHDAKLPFASLSFNSG